MRKIDKIRKKYFGLIIFILAFSAVCWDISTSLKYAVESGTYRYEHDFEPVEAFPTQVAIVTSDFEELQNQVNRSVDPGYGQIEVMVRKAIELQGGLSSVINKGDKVMLKVNLVGGNSPSGQGENTDVRVVKAVIKVIDEHCEGDVQIMVAEGTARANDDPTSASSVWEYSGYRALMTDPYLSGINLSLVNLNQTYNDLVGVNLGNKATAAPHNGHYMVHKLQMEADVFISVPVLKIHNTGMTGALKNQVGNAPGCYYGYNKMKGSQYYGGLVHDVGHRRWQEEEIVDLCLIADVDFVVMDAIMCLESGKSYTGSNQVRFNTILAGKDPVAIDHVGTRLFDMNPDDIPHITLAEKVGLGTNNPDKIEVLGVSIDEAKIRVKKNQSQHGRFGQSNRSWVLSEAFKSTDMSLQHIPVEATFIPEPGKDGWSQPVYFFDERIDLLSYYNGQSNIITYAFTYFDAPKDQQAELWVGSDEDLVVYINGDEVYSRSGTFSFGDDILVNDMQVIDLTAGENTLIVKSLHKFGDYSFSLNICEIEPDIYYQGNRVEGLKFYLPESGYITDPVTTHISPNRIGLKVYPNPTSFPVKIEFDLPVSGQVSVDIYDLSGKLVTSLVNKKLNAGLHSVYWSSSHGKFELGNGIYICSVKMGEYSRQERILLVK